MDSEEITVCTIMSKNYLAHARVFTDSFLKNNPNGKVFVLLVDDVNNKFVPSKEKFSLVNLEEIGIENVDSFCFKYTILEQNTGAKAHFIKYLFEKYKLKKLAYFDPDILFTNSLENLWNVLGKKSIVITPHLTEPLTDDKKPSEYDILRSGSYNLGFIALSNSKTTQNFIQWWIPHLMKHGFSDVNKGIFTDQKWIDLVPSLFDDVFIIRHPGYNVAFWNLLQRNIIISNNKVEVNGKPMYFFHFSGFSPEDMENVSIHQTRFTLKNLPTVRPLFELYRDLLVENGHLDIKDWKCKFDYFNNGVRIPPQARKIYNEALESGKNFKNPFHTESTKSFFKFLNENVDGKQPIITRLWHKIYKDREDLHELFHDPLGRDRQDFVNWLESSYEREYGFDKIFFESFLTRISSTQSNSNNTKLISETNQRKKENRNWSDSTQAGINISGYFKGEFGVAESARNFVFAIKSAGIPCVLNNINSTIHRNNDNTFSKFEKENPYPINLTVVNADTSKMLYDTFSSKYFRDKYNIAVWAWELENFPSILASSFSYYDEIWTLSNFVANTISKSSSIPVLKITCPVEIDEVKLVPDKEKFGLKKSDYVFLFIFDFQSVFERKNPLGLIEAFKKSFEKNENVKLVIKCINGSQFTDQYKKLIQACEEQNIKLFEEHFEKDELLSLLASCDCYVSLHRSEGFGLTIAEAMLAKKPIIATEYGGNTDFMNSTNSYPVKYKLIKLEKDFGPYEKGNVWAEPDIEHASSLMKSVFENQKMAEEKGIEASNYIKNKMNYNVMGNEILKRVKNIIKIHQSVKENL